jgi:hypothetical protein
MINHHVVYYMGSKLIAALLNLGTMVVSVRLGGAETYGAYVVMLAWGYILYSFTLQWLRFAFFATRATTQILRSRPIIPAATAASASAVMMTRPLARSRM